jgi:hypothetical protein
MIQKTNAAYLELHTYTSRWKNSQSFVHTSQRLDMCSTSHMADVKTIIQLFPNFVQSVPRYGSYGSCDSLASTLAKIIAEAGQTLCLLCSPTKRSPTEFSLAISVVICTTQCHWLLHDRSISGEGACLGGSEQACGSEAMPHLVGR